MIVLPQRMYRDPLEILERAEQRTCKGCIHKTKVWGVDYCAHPTKNGGRAKHRCKHYETGEVTK